MNRLYEFFLLLLALSAGSGSNLSGVFTSEQDIEASGGLLQHFICDVNSTEILASDFNLDKESTCTKIYCIYRSFKKLLPTIDLSGFSGRTIISKTFHSLLKLIRLKTCYQEGFIPEKNSAIWKKNEKIFMPNHTSKTELEFILHKAFLSFYENCEKLIENEQMSEEKLNYFNKLAATCSKLQEYFSSYYPKEAEYLYHEIIQLLVYTPVDFVSCNREQLKTLVWLLAVNYFIVIKIRDLENNIQSSLYIEHLQHLIQAMFRYQVLLSDNPEEQVERLKVFYSTIEKEVEEARRAEEQRKIQEEENGLTTSTSLEPDSDPESHSYSSSSSSSFSSSNSPTPPLGTTLEQAPEDEESFFKLSANQPTSPDPEQDMQSTQDSNTSSLSSNLASSQQPAAPQTTIRATPTARTYRRTPASTFTSELLRFFGW